VFFCRPKDLTYPKLPVINKTCRHTCWKPCTYVTHWPVRLTIDILQPEYIKFQVCWGYIPGFIGICNLCRSSDSWFDLIPENSLDFIMMTFRSCQKLWLSKAEDLHHSCNIWRPFSFFFSLTKIQLKSTSFMGYQNSADVYEFIPLCHLKFEIFQNPIK